MEKLLTFSQALEIAEKHSQDNVKSKLTRTVDKILDGSYLETDNYFLFFPRTDLPVKEPPTKEETIAELKAIGERAIGINFGGVIDLGIMAPIINKRNKEDVVFTFDFREYDEERKSRLLSYFYSLK